MKKCICLLLTLALLISNFASVYATDYSSNDNVATLTDSRYGFTYTEYVDENNQTIRTYKKQQSVTRSSAFSAEMSKSEELSHEATKALLASLGMEAGFVNKLSDQALQEYASSEEIYAVSSYTKIDSDGNLINVTKEEAMNAANSRAVVPAPDPGGGWPTYSTSFSDSYMYISYIVSYKGSGQYLFSIDSVWLTMPVFRWSDSLGACAQNMTVENNTRAGWRSYIITEEVNGTNTVHYIEEDLINGTNGVTFQNAINGNWYGSAVTFYMPIDGYTPYSSVIYSDYRVHYEYIGKVNYPDQQMNFSATATYCHFQTYLSIDPSIGIDAKGVTVTIGISNEERKEYRTVEFDTSISYIP